VLFRAIFAPLAAIAVATGTPYAEVGITARPLHRAPSAAPIAANDNRHPAGRLEAGVLTVRLEARPGVWRPEGPRGGAIATAAFAEEGRPLEVPGPLLRVPVGTRIRASIRNSLVKPMWLFGMGVERGISDSVLIAPGETREIAFTPREPGAFYYAARTGENPVFARLDEDSQLGGVIVVDAPDARPDPHERILAITSWFTVDPKTPSGLGPDATIAFNGAAWPHSERLTFDEGDSVHFRIVNISVLDHPLHLHGFYFTVDGHGDGARDTLYTERERRTGVTEYVGAMKTVSLSWVAARPGNWIFHCHFASHMANRAAFDADRSVMQPHSGHAMSSTLDHMSGLVLGMTVRPRGSVMQAGSVTRSMRLIVRSKPAVYGGNLGYSFALGGTPEEAHPEVMTVPGPVLELTKGERVAITIVNHSHDQAAVHWHGIELDSYPDGVPGVSGSGTNVLPMIEPGDSLTVQFTPPRAGTFMYHSHSNEMQQISSGLYGALIVREPGAPRDSVHDRILLLSDGGPVINFFDVSSFPPPLLNGERAPAPIELSSDRPTRLRLINIRSENSMSVSLLDGEATAQWRIVAKDGMALPAHQSGARSAKLRIASGEIYDVEVSPRAGSTLVLRYDLAEVSRKNAHPVSVPVRVR
jgi:FtsP/CotA-like multicopper oxidase with cupredoxin domain